MTASSAHAYIDPGEGALFLQMFLAGVVGALFYLSKCWKGIKIIFPFKNNHQDNKSDK